MRHYGLSKLELIEIDASRLSKKSKEGGGYFIRKLYEIDPLSCSQCQGEMRIISFIDLSSPTHGRQQPALWEESHAPSKRNPRVKQITFDPSNGSIN